MDWWFHKHPKYEREFQQVIARENNNLGNISRGTDYYIVDIEYANKVKSAEKSARFDMVALKWLSDGASRENVKKVSLALIEVKFGSGALQGKAGEYRGHPGRAGIEGIEHHNDDGQIHEQKQHGKIDFCPDSILFQNTISSLLPPARR